MTENEYPHHAGRHGAADAEMADPGVLFPPTHATASHHAHQGQAEEAASHHGLLARTESAFELMEQALVFVVAIFLIIFAMLSLVNVVMLTAGPIFLEHDFTKAIETGFDSAFMTIILLEVLHTVLSRASLVRQVQEFLVIGITSAVRHSLEVAAASNGTHEETRTVCGVAVVIGNHLRQICQPSTISVANSSSQEVVIELAINAGGVLILVAALWLVGLGKVRD